MKFMSVYSAITVHDFSDPIDVTFTLQTSCSQMQGCDQNVGWQLFLLGCEQHSGSRGSISRLGEPSLSHVTVICINYSRLGRTISMCVIGNVLDGDALNGHKKRSGPSSQVSRLIC